MIFDAERILTILEKLEEKWGKEITVSPSEKGKYDNWTIDRLESRYRSLKGSGPHKKGSKEYSQMREIAFALRAKRGNWGKVLKD